VAVAADELKVPKTVREAIKAALGLLTAPDRRRYRLVVVAQMLTSFLDLAGVLLVGLVGVLAAASIQGTPPPDAVLAAADRLGLGDLPPEALAGIVAATAAAFLLTKSVVSAVLMRRVFRFLGNRQAAVSTRLTAQLLAQPLLAIERRSSQETAYALSNAIAATIIQTLGSLAVLLSELTLLALLSIALFIVNPAATIAAFIFFALVGFALQRGLSGWSARIGGTIGATAVLGQKHLQEAIVSYREVSVLGRRSLYVSTIGALWQRSGSAQGDQMFVSQLPKIGYETALVIGAIGLASWQFAVSTPVEAVAMLALFLAAGSRVVPSMLRLNSLTLGIRSGVASAAVLFPIVDELQRSAARPLSPMNIKDVEESTAAGFPGFTPTIEISNASVTYPGAPEPALSSITLSVPAGSKVALAGTTGAGKSTLADVILGVLEPQSGSVRVSGMDVNDAINMWPGALAYVPQNVAMINGTVRENVALGLPADAIDDDQVWHSLQQAHLAGFLSDSRDGLDTLIGERGVRLSGGQRQRLGLARALYSRPKLLVLDEATSALDAETEVLIADALAALSDEVTTVTVAHRLAPIRHSDIVVYLEDGYIRALGSFDEVRESSSAFHRQATLLGL
jgi:ABC-type multidrug transport system fused ATPase/permease subunit